MHIYRRGLEIKDVILAVLTICIISLLSKFRHCEEARSADEAISSKETEIASLAFPRVRSGQIGSLAMTVRI